MNIDDTLRSKQKEHGDFYDNSRISQQLKEVLRSEEELWDRLSFYEREAMDNICQKLGRLLASSNAISDHAVDIAGYSRLMQLCDQRGESQDVAVLTGEAPAGLISTVRTRLGWLKDGADDLEAFAYMNPKVIPSDIISRINRARNEIRAVADEFRTRMGDTDEC